MTGVYFKFKHSFVNRVALGNCMGLGTRPYSVPWWGQLAWFIVFALMLLLAILGNTLVIWIVLAHRRMRTVTNCFLVNLAVADLLMATLNGAPNFVFLVTAHWPFGAATCTASNFTANLTVSAGVFTLVAITVDRYVAIVKPLQHRLSRKVARAALFTVWCASALLALPSLLYSDTYKKQYINGEREICFIKWPDGSYPTSKTDYFYNIVFLGVTYVLPMSVMVWAYVRMSAALRGRAIGECTHHQMQVVRAKRKGLDIVKTRRDELGFRLTRNSDKHLRVRRKVTRWVTYDLPEAQKLVHVELSCETLKQARFGTLTPSMKGCSAIAHIIPESLLSGRLATGREASTGGSLGGGAGRPRGLRARFPLRAAEL
ncbi:hypothetical protein ACJJTC_019796 [Scirpophaga incertulas]